MWFEVPDQPDAGTVEEWDKFEEDARKHHPVRFFLSWTLPIRLSRTWRQLVREPWYWLKCRLWHQYNVVRIQTLPPTWNDRDEVMLHACFQCLVDFIEKENPFEYGAGAEVQEPRRKADIELVALYDWWILRPVLLRRIDDVIDRYPRGTAPRDAYEQAGISYSDLRAEDQAMLTRLIAVRKYMWT
jgi:hypothetical protein